MKLCNPSKNASICLLAATSALIASGCLGKSEDATGANAAIPRIGSAATSSGRSLSTLAPTADALVGRIEKGLNGVSPIGISHRDTASNCGRAFALVGANLNTNPNPGQANAGAPVSQLIFSCCSDVVAKAKLADFGVRANATDALSSANRAAITPQIVGAGVRILDQYLAGLASSGDAAIEVSRALTTQVAESADGTRVRDLFAHACLASVAYGATMTGF